MDTFESKNFKDILFFIGQQKFIWKPENYIININSQAYLAFKYS